MDTDTLAQWTVTLKKVIFTVNIGFLAILLLQTALYVIQLVIAFFELRTHRERLREGSTWWLLTNGLTLPISILVPAYNEQATIVENIHSLLSLHYPDFEVIVINDGSKDKTLEEAVTNLGLKPIDRVYDLAVAHKQIRGIYGSPRYPRLIVVDKESGGKSDALNAGINLSRCPLFCAVDADSVLDADALLRVVRPFIEAPEEMVAVGGRIRIVNGCTVRAGQVVEVKLPTQPLALFQSVEYIRAFLMARLAWSRLNAMLIISGAFGVFKRSVALQVGGYTHGTVGEDMEIVTKIHRLLRDQKVNYQMRYVPDPVCWTESPVTLAVLRRQRSRWQRGMMETLSKHRAMIFSPKYGSVGILGLGNFFILDVLEPIMELAGLIIIPLCWALNIISGQFLLAYISLIFVFGVFISVISLFLEELSLAENPRPADLLTLTLCAIAENFGYRQINNLWRLEGIWQFLRKKQGWGAMTRTGFQKGKKT